MDRQYGVRPGSGLNGTPPPPPYTSQRPTRRVQSPQKRVVSPFEEYHYPQTSLYNRNQKTADDHPPGQGPPPPPAHRTMVHQTTPPRQAYGGASLPGSEVSLYSPQDSRTRALNAVDNLYSPRLNSPSPERGTYFHSPYRDASPPVKQTIPRRPVSKIPTPMAVPVPAMSPFQQARDRTPMLASHEQDLPRSAYYNSDGYDDINPSSIADDPDDVFQDPTPRVKSRMGFARPFSRTEPVGMATSAAASGLRGSSGAYHAVSDSQIDLPDKRWSEKSDWREQEQADRRRRKRIFIILGVLLVVGIIVGAVVGAIVATRKQAAASTSTSTTTSSSTSSGTHSGGLYDINSKEIQAVLGNTNLHKVFPGMDYTPLNSQYPDCLQNPPDQNNVTLDIAVLSQLTPAVRLYGTDCGQTEAVLTAIDRLNMNDTMQVWLGVWLGNNITTNDRQLAQMYNILDKYPVSHFAGIIIGNEVLFREDLTLYQLSNTLTQVRTNLTAKKISLPLATSDLGDNWTAGLAATSDIIMANIHPFFAGVTPDVAPGWAWNFWQTRDSSLTPASTGSWPKSIISEVGWPSEGGNDCGTGTSACAAGKGAVATIDNMNTFMNGFICQSLTNGTTFFWFSAFDEPWKAIFNTASDQWESHWGLMDVNRNLKSGLSIPDCGGKTITKAY